MRAVSLEYRPPGVRGMPVPHDGRRTARHFCEGALARVLDSLVTRAPQPACVLTLDDAFAPAVGSPV